jgi:hypothetical protein
VLVLITRSDLSLREWYESQTENSPREEDLRTLARRLDPRQWVKEILGFDLASSLRAQLEPQAHLAVGIVATAANAEEAAVEFGLAETLAFLLTGRTQAPLDLVTAGDGGSENWLELESEPQGAVGVAKQAKVQAAKSAARPRLFLRPERTGRASRAPAIARWLRLDSYSDRLLTKAARHEMGLLAGLLLGVGVFELTAWTLLFNAIFHADVLETSKLSWAAAALGVLFASAIVYLDRSFLVADPAQKGHRRAAVFRVAVVAVSALATSLAVDLIFFEKPINARRHEEQIRHELVKRAGSLHKDWDPQAAVHAGSKEGNPFLVMASGASGDIARLQAKRDSLQRQEDEKRAEAQGLRRRIGEIDRDIQRVERNSNPENSLLGSDPAVEKLRDRRDKLLGQAARAEDKADDLASQGSALSLRMNKASERHQNLLDEADSLVTQELQRVRDLRSKHEADSERLVAWITFLRRSNPPEKALKEEQPPGEESAWTYQLADIDLFDRFRILFDLLAGRPPLWPEGAPAELAELRQRFHLEDPAPCAEPRILALRSEEEPSAATEPTKPCDETAWVRNQKRARFFTKCFFLLLCVAAVVPLTVLVLKLFLMPRALSCYYSLAHQAAAGDADAMLVLQTLKQEGDL